MRIMKIEIDGIPVQVTRKQIKNVNFHIKGPDAHVEVSVPSWMKEPQIREIITSKLVWIRKKQQECSQHPKPLQRRFLTGESLWLWGESYSLRTGKGEDFTLELRGDTALLSLREGSTLEQTTAFVREWYRLQLQKRIWSRLPFLQEQTGLHCSSWQIKNMKTRWGTCNTQTKKIWLNLQLAKHPPECLDYVLVHELVHTLVPNHSTQFYTQMDRLMPQWRQLRKQLQNSPIPMESS